MPTAYCVKCREKVEIKNPIKKTWGKRHGLQGTCPECGTKVTTFVKA